MKKTIKKLLNKDNIAFIFEDRIYKYSEIINNSLSIMNLFKKKGIESGDRIAVKIPNSLEFIYCYFASLFGNFTIIPINIALSQEKTDYILKLTSPSLYINKKEMLLTENKKNDFDLVDINRDNLLAIFFTSGTSSENPKGVCHTTSNLINNVESFNSMVNITEKTTMYHVMPMGYMAGFLNTVLSPFLAGGKIVLGKQFSAFSALTFWDYAIKNNVNTIWLSPTMLQVLTKLNRDEEVSKWSEENLKNVFVGTAPLYEKIREDFEHKFKTKCFESYGMSEVLLVSSQLPGEENTISSVGRVLPEVELKFTADNELLIKTPNMFMGYLDSNGNIIKKDKEEFFRTGDLGEYIKEELYITGRCKDLIIHGGININPREIENELLKDENINNAAVIGKRDEFWGEKVIAFLELHNPHLFNEKNTRNTLNKVLIKDAIPDEFIILEKIPKNKNGKILKNELRRMI